MDWKEVFDYDHATGGLTWKTERPLSHFKNERGRSVWRKMYSGRPAGIRDKHGYLRVRLSKVAHSAHRIIWEMHHGPIPDGLHIDHINGAKDDNRLCNIRLATRSQNLSNRGAPRHNTTGVKGVCWAAREGKWVAYIRVNGRRYHLGYFTAKEAARTAYQAASARLHGEFGRAS